MKIKFFWIPARDSHAAEAELNIFLAVNRVVQVEKSFCPDADGPGWALCVQWLPGAPDESGALLGVKGSRVDYREILDEPTFRIFSALRIWRKDRATADGVPIYTVATNEQLAAISRERVLTAGALQKLVGFGTVWMTKCANSVLVVPRNVLGIKD